MLEGVKAAARNVHIYMPKSPGRRRVKHPFLPAPLIEKLPFHGWFAMEKWIFLDVTHSFSSLALSAALVGIDAPIPQL